MSRSPVRGGVILNEQIHRRAAELLADEDWHDYERVLRELMRAVPPGIAVRRNERDRRSTRTASGGPAPEQRVYPITPEERVRSGRRAIVREALRTDSFELKPQGKVSPGDVRQIRMVRLPRVVRGDRLRGEYVLPSLNALAATFKHEGMPEALDHVREVAHDNGLHLRSCPPDCKGLLPQP